MIRWSKVQFDPGQAAHFQRLLDNPRTRAAASRILNQQSEHLKRIAEDIADADLHRRTPDRRNLTGRDPKNHSPMPGYHASFRIVPARDIGPGKMHAAMRNDHMSARMVENGTQPHDIPISPPNVPKLKFPYKGHPVGKGGPGAKGQFAVTAMGGFDFFSLSVSHPGAGARHIMRRARDRYRREQKRILNR